MTYTSNHRFTFGQHVAVDAAVHDGQALAGVVLQVCWKLGATEPDYEVGWWWSGDYKKAWFEESRLRERGG